MSGERILIVDDSKEIIKHLTEHVLPTFGYKTLHAYDGRTGLQLIRQEKPDLVMLDFQLPEMTGIDVLQEMTQESINIPVVLMTGYGSELSAIEAFRLGAKDYIIKPFTVDEIVETIERALVETRLAQDKENLGKELRRIKAEISRQANEIKTLAKIGTAITSLLDVDKVLERVLDAATYLTNAEESAIWLPAADGKTLKAYERKNGQNETPPLTELSLTDSQIGQVMRSGQPLRQSVFSGQGIKVKTGFFARAVLYVPLKLRGITLGVLGVSNVAAFRSFSKQDEFLLSFLADYAAIALENARVFQAADQALAARLEELSTLIEITRTITSSLNIDEIVELTIQQVHNSWNIEASSLWWVDKERQTLRVISNIGTPSDVLTDIDVPLGEGFVGYVVETGKWIFSNDVSSHPQHYRQIDQKTGFETRSLLCVPLVFRGEVVGAMQFLNKRNGEFDDLDVERALSIAAAVAIAYTNALLFEQVDSSKKQLETILEYDHDPILVLDVNGKLHFLNQQARQHLHLTNEVVGQPFDQVLALPALVSLLDQREVDEAVLLTLADGSVWRPHAADLPGYGRILTLEETAVLPPEQSTLTEIESGLDEIHDLAQQLNQTGSLTAEQSQAASTILQITNKLQELLPGEPETAVAESATDHLYRPCNMGDIVQEIVQNYQAKAAAKQVTLSLTAESEIEPIAGDPAQLTQAIAQLVENAIQNAVPNKEVTITLLGKDDFLQIEIHNTEERQGVDSTALKEAYHEGTRQPLTAVQTIAKAHGGQMWVESNNGTGSTVIFLLPRLSRSLNPQSAQNA